MIQDQYEEEYFLSFLKPKATASTAQSADGDAVMKSGNSSQEGSPGKPSSTSSDIGEGNKGMVYKYFSELTPEDIRKYECRPDLHSGFGNETSHMQERGNVFGVSVPNVNEWVVDIVKDGAPKSC